MSSVIAFPIISSGALASQMNALNFNAKAQRKALKSRGKASIKVITLCAFATLRLNIVCPDAIKHDPQDIP